MYSPGRHPSTDPKMSKPARNVLKKEILITNGINKIITTPSVHRKSRKKEARTNQTAMNDSSPFEPFDSTPILVSDASEPASVDPSSPRTYFVCDICTAMGLNACTLYPFGPPRLPAEPCAVVSRVVSSDAMPRPIRTMMSENTQPTMGVT